MDGEPPAKRNRRDEPSTSGTQLNEDEMNEDESSSKPDDQLKDGESEPTNKNTTTEDCYKIESSYTRYNKLFKTEVIEHIIHFSEVHINQCIEERQDVPYKLFLELFEHIIDTLIRPFPERDRILIEIHVPGSDRPIYVPNMEVRRMNADVILNAFQQVQQSNREIKLDGKMELHVIHIEVPNGSGDIGNELEEDFLKGKKSIIRIRNRDNICLARALVTARARIEHENGDKTINWENIRKGLGEQTRLAKDLHTKAGAFKTSCNILDDIPKFQDIMKDYQILVVPMTGYKKSGFLFKGPVDRLKKLYILFTTNHFHVITSMKGFLECGYFCERCWKGFKTFEHHRCINMCECCFNNVKDGCVLDTWRQCKDCKRLFKSSSCYDRHKKVPEAMESSKKTSQAKTICQRIKWCTKCNCTIKDQHTCGYAYCDICKTKQPFGHLCYMQPIRNNSQKKDEDDDTEFETNRKRKQVYIFFDFECRQDEQRAKEEYLHRVNYCVAQRVCVICMDKEEVQSSCGNCKSLQKSFKGDNTLQDFCTWLLSPENWHAIVIAHNMKGYDGHFILKYLPQVGICPKVIMNGSKLMVIQFRKLKIIDSLNFIPFPLSKFPKTFDITKKKGYFPHRFNTKANETYKGPWPPKQSYAPEQMKEDERKVFEKWYDEHKGNVFDMAAEIDTYCQNDVTLLRRGCSIFRSLFLETTEEDPFQTSLTIASVCMRVFRKNFLEKETIAIVPSHAYRGDRYSLEALRWLRWKEKVDKLSIKHSRNGGEKRIENYKVDGYCKSAKKIYEFHGCYWHGCVKCYPDRNTKGRGYVTMGESYQRYIIRQKFLKENCDDLEEIWECEYNQQLQKDPDMKAFVEDLDIIDPLEPRDAFYGGRTNVIKLHHGVKTGERIKYIDVCSLYPWVNKYGKYPIGHPQIITEKLTTNILQYEGLIKCTILPPGDLFHPVLPYRCEDKLLFPLCAECAKQRQKGPCSHLDKERALCGTWVTDEVKKALNMGYTLQRVHEVWHFQETRKYDREGGQEGLFTEYVNTFLELKQEASGWPSDCQPEKADLERSEFINKYKEKEGIALNAENIKRNEGKRALAKLMLNSFWGKFGQRSNLPQTEYVQKLEKYYQILRDDTKVIKSMSFVSDSTVQIQWQDKDENVRTMPNTNVFIAAYTTALARLKLYSFLEKLDRRVLYFDTDSIIYLSKEGEYEPPTGNFLGDMTDELSKPYGEGSYIKEFVSGGPKNYAYEVFNPSKDKTFFECKVKGITMNFETKKQINFDVMKQHLEFEIADNDLSDEYDVAMLSKKETPIHDQRIIHSKEGIVTKDYTKTYRIVSDKRRVKKDLTTLPFGFKS